MQHFATSATWAVVLLGLLPTLPAQEDADLPPRRRQPVAMIIEGDRLLVANQSSGSISIVDRKRRAVVAERNVAARLSDLASWSPGRLLATDPKRNRLLLIESSDNRLNVLGQLSLDASPVSVVVSRRRRLASVASLWARRIQLIGLGGAREGLSVQRVVDLPFAPRKQLILPDGKTLLVAESFGGRLARIDLEAGTLESVLSVPGHNIRGLASSRDGKQVLFAHQMLTEFAPTTRSNVFWGTVTSNILRMLPIDKLQATPTVSNSEDIETLHGGLYPLGHERSGAGDPGELAVTERGQVIVCLSGVGEIAIQPSRYARFERLRVGRHPTALAWDAEQQLLFVANTFDDAISVVDVRQQEVIDTILLGPQPPLDQVARGEQLFYDASISLDGWFSCHSCHTDGHTNGLLNDNFSDGGEGAPKRILSLLGTAAHGPWAWNGQQATLEGQIDKSLRETMRGFEDVTVPKDKVDALAAFLRTLRAPPSLDEARRDVDPVATARGRKIFQRRACDRCHTPPHYTSAEVVDVGLVDAKQNRAFNPPSLDGVSQRDSFFHDGRAASLHEVFATYKHPDGQSYDDAEVRDLLAFLRSL